MFDYDFDDVQLMENIVQEETEKENEVNITDQPEPEIILPTFSEIELNAAREEGFNAGKENGITEALASIENSISQTMSTIVDEILNLETKFLNKDIYIIGGPEIINQTFDLFKEFYLTRIYGNFNCDKFIDIKKITNTMSLIEKIDCDETCHFEIWKK